MLKITFPISDIPKRSRAATAESLKRAEEIMRADASSAEERLKFFEDKLCEGMTAFLIQNAISSNDNYQAWLDQIWQEFRQQDATRPLATYIITALAPYDRTYILSKVMERASQSNLEHSYTI